MIVTALHINDDSDFTDVAVVDANGSESVLHTTQHHPFWNATTGAWTEAETLRSSDQLAGLDGATSQVQSVKSFTAERIMYDLTVEGVHTYYVLAGEMPVMVHNCGVPDLGAAWKAKSAATVCGKGGCEAVADGIQSQIGGDIMRITDKYGAPSLGQYRGVDSGWQYHDVVVKDGRVFDATTGRNGELMNDYMSHWQYGDDLLMGPAPR